MNIAVIAVLLKKDKKSSQKVAFFTFIAHDLNYKI